MTHGAGRRPGDVVVLREVWRGRVWTARPATLVADEPDAGLRFFVPRGSVAMMPFTTDGRPLHAFVDAGDRWDLRPTAWRETNVLSFAKRGRPHAVLAFWDASWAFVGWYVNLQTPLEPTAIGFDYLDQELDAWVDPDAGTWSWKDEDELERSVAAGIWTDADAERIRREGAAIAADVVERRRPFDRDWPAWRPDPDWPVPELPPGWDAGRPVPRAPRR